MANETQGPAWDLSDEYASFQDPAFSQDRTAVEEAIASLERAAAPLAAAVERAAAIDPAEDRDLVAACRECLAEGEKAHMLLSNLRTYVSCVLAVDGGDVRGKELRGELTSLGSRREVAAAPVALLLALAPEAFFEACVSDPSLARHRFRLAQERKLARHRLSLPEEKLLAAMAPDGFAAWGSLYDTLGGALVCELETPGGKRRMGLSAAASLLRGGDRPLREAAWRAIDAAYAAHEETCAAILNALAGWRRAECALRSRAAPLHFLEPALHQNRLSARTLDAMMAAVDAGSRIGREALALQARAMGIARLEVWDILAGAPPLRGAAEPPPIPFEAGLDLVCRAYEAIDPAMAAFARGEAAASRVEGRRLPAKRPGAFCTSFDKSRRTRVFMTYGGSLSEVSTLAHELGHAYHSSLMADIPLPESDYPMSLAETASTLAEAALGELLAREAKDDSALLELGWSDAQDAATFLLNIPARLSFERELYDRRAERPQGPEALGDLMESAWRRYYGDALASYDRRFWCTKLHFYKTDVSFYNFPYTFGYLFSLGLLARREELGERFPAAYAALLRDTGRMEVEELARVHLGVDLTQRRFWEDSIGMVGRKIDGFRALVDRICPGNPPASPPCRN